VRCDPFLRARGRSSWLLPCALAALWWAGLTAYAFFQEAPAGWLTAKVIAEESGRPLPGAVVRLHRLLPFAPDLEAHFAFVARKDGSLRAARIPAGTYRLEASSRAHTLRPTRVDIAEAKTTELALELSPNQPFLELRMPEHVFTPQEAIRVVGHGFSPESAMDVRLYRVDPVALLRRHHGNLYQLLAEQQMAAEVPLDAEAALTNTRERRGAAGTSPLMLSLPISGRDVEGVFHQRFDLQAQEPGIYVIEMQLGDLREREWAMVTRLGLIVKHWAGGTSALAFVTDLVTGEPVPGAKVSFYREKGLPVSATTDERGICTAKLAGEGGQYDLMVIAEKDGSQAFLTSWVYQGEGSGKDRVYAYTDRPVYRPGDTVRFRGLAREFVEPRYRVVGGEPVTLEVRDARDTLVYRGQTTTNDYGSYQGEFALSEEAATGYYQMVTTLRGRQHEAGFKVAEYRKPEYEVEVATGKKRYSRGEHIQARVTARYYFGAPVAGARVTYAVMRAPYWFYPEEDEEAEYESEDYEGDYYSYGEVVEQGSAITDEEGVARLSIATKRLPVAGQVADEGDSDDYRYTIAVRVTDPSRKEVTGQGSTLVTAGEFALSAGPARWVLAPGEEAEIAVRARDYESRPVRQQQVRVTAGLELWSENKLKVEPAAHSTLTTDGKGEAVFRFTPEVPGHYRVEAAARDRRGNKVSATAFLWVTGEAYADLRAPYPEIEIITDKKRYRVGETATVLINTEVKEPTALVGVEGARLYDCRLLALKANSTRFEIPVRPEYAPSFFLSVSFVKGKQFVSHTKRIKVSVEEQGLQLALKPDKGVYSPGERATYQLTARDWQGKPVVGEFSVGVVDEAIYAIQEEMAEPMLRFFYPPRGNRVDTDYSFPSIYLDADKGAAGIKVRKRFPDTAYWNPAVVTAADGTARISFQVPDTLTTWRATVRGATMATEVGETVTRVKCTKDLLVRLEAPRFLVQNDRLTISAVAHNYTRSRQEVKIWLEAPGLLVRRGPESKAPARLALEPDGVQRQDWQIEVPGAGRPEVTVYIRGDAPAAAHDARAGGGLSDAMALTLPALPHGRERVEWRSGGVQEQASERLTVRQDAVPGASDLRIRLSPSVAATLLGALEYLAQYPYGCTEQTMSAFLPDVVVARALRELDIANSELEKKLPDMVRKGCDRLYGFQHGDGGWGWWRYDESDPWMTAYVVFGLVTAQEAGFPVNEHVLTRATARLKQLLTQEGRLSPRDQAYVCYVLTLAGKGELVNRQLTKLCHRADALDTSSLALVTAALTEQGQLRLARVSAERLWRRAHKTQAFVWWPGSGDYGRGGDIETTALAFQSLYALAGDDPRLLKAVRWLVLNRQGSCWVSTRDTAFAVLALTDFVKQSEELRPDFQTTVSLDGKVILSRRFTREDLFAPEVEIRASGGALGRGDHVLQVRKEGAGNLYYTAILKQAVFQEDIPRIITSAGISVERSYYRLVSQRDPTTGAIVTRPAPAPTTEFRSGEPTLVRLTIRAPREHEFIIIEDPLPAGCEVSERGDLEQWEWSYWYSDMEVRDEKVAFFARHLPLKSVIEYHLRPQIPGDYHVMPTQVYSMYNPELRGSAAETRVRLR